MNPFYILLFCVLVFHVGIFIVVSFLPKQMQKSFVKKFAISSNMESFLKFHFVFCLILAIFFFDLHSTQINFEEQKRNLQMTGGYMATGSLQIKIRVKKGLLILFDFESLKEQVHRFHSVFYLNCNHGLSQDAQFLL